MVNFKTNTYLALCFAEHPCAALRFVNILIQRPLVCRVENTTWRYQTPGLLITILVAMVNL